mmetsp:Transcript_12848/g.28375  ORF Transcript_12848/g.28375 Transcript_12848/m.28375 type:complete len:617 (+) Transcript_12848:39-1889(+)
MEDLSVGSPSVSVGIPAERSRGADAVEPGSPTSYVGVNSVQIMFEGFSNQREAEKKRLYYCVLRVGWLFMAFGSPAYRAGESLSDVIECVGLILIIAGVLIISSCPVGDVDVDLLLQSDRCLRLMLCLPPSALLVYLAISIPPYLFCFSGLCFLLACCNFEWNGKVVLPPRTTLLSSGLALTLVGFAGNDFFIWLDPTIPSFDPVDCPHHSWMALTQGILFLSVLVLMAAVRFSPVGCMRLDMSSRTCVLYYTLYTVVTSVGLGHLWQLVSSYLDANCFKIALLVEVLIWLAPAAIVVTFGRETIFGFVARRFERNSRRVQRDGALVAELLNRIPVVVGQTWWLHHGRNDASYPEESPKRNWERGQVTSVQKEKSRFSVRLGGRGSDLWLPLPDDGVSAIELLSRAQLSLRCIDWINISRELMDGALCGPSVELKMDWYSLSRPVASGKAIDFFISHSWHDSSAIKFEQLQMVAESFLRQHGRYPTFWLDKVCIDQSCLTDSLKVLPVNVMSCSRVLVLCGHTYARRLWCAWELFVLFSFARKEQAVERAVVRILDKKSDALAQLARFDVNCTSCYDPNEEARLRLVIDAISAHHFNERIRACAREVIASSSTLDD